MTGLHPSANFVLQWVLRRGGEERERAYKGVIMRLQTMILLMMCELAMFKTSWLISPLTSRPNMRYPTAPMIPLTRVTTKNVVVSMDR